jgi:hypothetical protein
MSVTTPFASVLDSAADFTSVILALLAFAALFLLLEAFDRV